MPIGTMADFKIYDEQYYGGQLERLTQNITAFNAASNGALLLIAQLVKGQFEREAFMKMVAGLIARRDPTSVGAVADAKLVQGEFVGPKVNKRIGPVAGTLDEWKKISEDPQLFSFLVGKLVADQKLQNMVNTAIMAVQAALAGQAALNHTIAATIKHTDLVATQALMGDQASRIACWVMHSKVYHDLIGQAVTDKIVNVADVAIYQGTVATFGKPTLVIDAPALLVAGAPNTYNTLGLVAGAVEVKESETETVVMQPVTGLENLAYRLQGEYAYNLRIKGFRYDTTQGANPADATLAAAASWIKEATDNKDLAGVQLVSQ